MGKYVNANIGSQGKYVKTNIEQNTNSQQETGVTNNTGNNNVQKFGTNFTISSQQKAEVLNKVTIPMYFKEIIEPQLPGYFDVYAVDFDNDPRACCPLHDEDTPSFRYYEETSSFYCFGCQKGGNILNLHRYFAERLVGRSIDNDEASAFLYNYFIRGKEQTNISGLTTTKISKPTATSTDIELVRLNTYRYNTEHNLSFDKTLSLETKKKLWEVFDTVDILVSKNIINAADAVEYIKQEINKLTQEG